MFDILSMYFKYYPMTFFSIYVFRKISNLRADKKTTVISLLLSLILTTIMILLRENIPAISMIVYIVGIIGCDILLYRQPLETTTIAGTISFGIACAMHTVALFITIPGYIVIHLLFENAKTVSMLADGLCLIINCVACILPFRTKRLKNGMPFLQKEKINNVGVFIAFLIPLATAVMDLLPNNDFYVLVPLIYMCLACLLLFFWWRSMLKKNYFEELRTREINTLNYTIEQQNSELETLKTSNDELSRIIHTDNKVIPAMEESVADAIHSLAGCNLEQEQRNRLRQISDRLAKMGLERKNYIYNYEEGNKQLPLTNTVSVDATAKYMAHRAFSEGIEFNLTVSGDIKSFIDSVVPESDFNTLLADLTENAIIATKEAEKKHILVVLGTEHNACGISVIDSGISFEPSSFKYLGIRRNTTHKSTGGSGIGLMSTIELCKKHGASFIIDEVIPEGIYVKKVSVCFDGLSQIRVKTTRPEILEVCSTRKEITLLNPKI